MAKPDFTAYIVTQRKDKDDFWNRIGGCFKFKTKDGREGIRVPSLNLVILERRDDNDEPPADVPASQSEE